MTTTLPPPPAPVLRAGLWVWVYPKRSASNPAGGWPDVGAMAADLVRLGATGVIPQNGLGTLAWVTAEREARVRAAGLDLAVGLGSYGPGKWNAFASATVGILQRGLRVMLDWEESWCRPEGRPSAQRCVDYVLTRCPDAVGRVTDCPWWNPLYTLDAAGHRQDTHPHAPTREFGVLCARDRYVQAYGAARTYLRRLPDGSKVRVTETPREVQGRSTRMLRWARDPSQYASMGAWSIRPALQAYRRTVADHVALLTAEPTVALWDYVEIDADCRTGLRCAAELRQRGFTGADAVRAFQASAGLDTDNLCGPLTTAALLGA